LKPKKSKSTLSSVSSSVSTWVKMSPSPSVCAKCIAIWHNTLPLPWSYTTKITNLDIGIAVVNEEQIVKVDSTEININQVRFVISNLPLLECLPKIPSTLISRFLNSWNVTRMLSEFSSITKKEAKRVSNSGSLPTSDPESETCILPTRVSSSGLSHYFLLSRFFEHASDFQQNIIKSIFNPYID